MQMSTHSSETRALLFRIQQRDDALYGLRDNFLRQLFAIKEALTLHAQKQSFTSQPPGLRSNLDTHHPPNRNQTPTLPGLKPLQIKPRSDSGMFL